MPREQTTDVFEAEFQALLTAHLDNQDDVVRRGEALGCTEHEIARARHLLRLEFETAWLLLRIEYGMDCHA